MYFGVRDAILQSIFPPCLRQVEPHTRRMATMSMTTLEKRTKFSETTCVHLSRIFIALFNAHKSRKKKKTPNL